MKFVVSIEFVLLSCNCIAALAKYLFNMNEFPHWMNQTLAMNENYISIACIVNFVVFRKNHTYMIIDVKMKQIGV